MKAYIRKKLKKKRRSGWYRYYLEVLLTARENGVVLTKHDLPRYRVYDPHKIGFSKPAFGPILDLIAKRENAFSVITSNDLPEDGIFEVPHIFSLTENEVESNRFIKSLFYALYYDNFKNIIIDYKKCQRIDIDACVCMDIILREFQHYILKCRKKGYRIKIDKIVPLNFNSPSISKVLFSIGSFKVLKNFEVKFPDIIPFHLMVGDNESKSKGKDKEVEVTKMVDYIVECLDKMGHNLTWQAENHLSKVIGEILINAAEHSGSPCRYAIGYFQQTQENHNHVGVFNLTILSFGRTIYENFKNEDAKDLDVVKQMAELSKRYTDGNLFRLKSFEEETLWTLYALQEGVTSVKDKKRGNGSIQFIENFFNLKGDMSHDNQSRLVVLSGNCKIIFDGKYQIKEKTHGENTFKLMTFNESGSLEDKPDEKYVTFADNFFPGTMIATKIYINFKSVEKEVV